MSAKTEIADGVHTSYCSSFKQEVTYKDGKRNGLTRCYDSDELFEEANYKDDELDGEYLLFYTNGKLRQKLFYQKGIREGKSQLWYDNGQILEVSNYVNGKIIGERKIWSRDGKLMYHDDGKKIIVIIDKKDRDCVLPDGEFECWKACKTENGTNVYVKLIVPPQAKRLTCTHNYKGRVEYAHVAQIIDVDGNEYKEAYSFVHIPNTNKFFKYEAYKKVEPDEYDDDYRSNCSKGISVFLHKDMCDYYFT